jgi:hypothetical protein
MPELSLDNDQRHALVGHLDRVRMPELVLVPTSAQTPLRRPLGYADQARRVAARGGFGCRKGRHNPPPAPGSVA